MLYAEFHGFGGTLWNLAEANRLPRVVGADELDQPRAVGLEAYFGRIGLALVVDEAEGYAFVRQWSDDKRPAGYEDLPRLVRRMPIGYGPTLLAVLLRDELRRFEEDDVHNERCVVELEAVFEQWKTFFPPQHDEVRQRKEFIAAMKKLEDLGFARKFSESPESWEIRRILKAKLPAAELERLKEQFVAAVAHRNVGEGDIDA